MLSSEKFTQSASKCVVDAEIISFNKCHFLSFSKHGCDLDPKVKAIKSATK